MRRSRFLAGLLQRPQLIEEVLDDTMMVVWQSAGNFRGASKLSTWIFAIAFIITSITLTVLSARSSSSDSVVDQLGGTLPASQPLVPGADGLGAVPDATLGAVPAETTPPAAPATDAPATPPPAEN